MRDMAVLQNVGDMDIAHLYSGMVLHPLKKHPAAQDYLEVL